MPFATMELVRTVAAPAAAVRTALSRALRDLRFEITSERLGGLEAKRGSQLAAGALQMKKAPVGVSVDVGATEEGVTLVTIRLHDRWRSPVGKAWGANSTYRAIFTEVATGLDAALTRLDPAMTTGPHEFTSSAAEVGLLERGNAATGVAGERAVGRVDQMLGGAPPPKPSGPQVVIALPEEEAILDAERVQGMLTVALLVSRHPGAMPAPLVADVERVAGQVERVLEAAQPGLVPVITLEASDKPVVSFLSEQARVREALPVRTMQRCTTCRHEKVVNPDYQRLMERNRKLRGISGVLGASVTPHGVSPFVALGRIMPLVKLDPDYVCPRCQGLEADDHLVVFCPNCGERRDEAALRSCARCQHDFRKALPAEPLWLPVGTAAARFAPPAPPVAAAPPAPPAAVHAPPVPAFPPGYYADPQARYEARWWDGFQWTDQVIAGGRPMNDGSAPAAPIG